jgi:hypothetical protein
VSVPANEILRLAVKIGEIASPASGDKNFLAGALAPLQNRDFAPAFARFDGTHESRSSSAEDQSVKFVNCFLSQEPSQFRGLIYLWMPLLVCSRVD